MIRVLAVALLGAGCTPAELPDPLPPTAPTGAPGVSLAIDGATLSLTGPDGARLDGLRFALGAGTQTITERLGAYLFEDVTTTWTEATGLELVETTDDRFVVEARDGALVLGRVVITSSPGGIVDLDVQPAAAPAGGTPRLRLSLACDADETLMGAGSHAYDVVHTGEAFALWVSEPGVGKVPVETPPEDWFQRGTRHASSYPVPFLLRAQQPSGLLLDTTARVEVDLCAADPGRMSLVAWTHALRLRLIDGSSPLQVVERLTALTGRPRRLPDWALMPWIDTFGDATTLVETVDAVRDVGAPGSVVWTEDWKGAEPNATGYRLSESWTVDRELYPDVEGDAARLRADGWAWFGYFAPFVGLTHPVGADARAADALIADDAGAELTFTLANFQPGSLVDLSGEAGRGWARDKMQAAVDLGFVGWMTDFAEWLPVTARLDDGRDGLVAHNDYPRMWQTLVEEVLAPIDGVHFCRSGWVGTSGTCPVVWLGDQATDFGVDDGLPTIPPLALGLSASGVPVVTHDVGGYQSFTTTTRDRELWIRWASLSAFSPILRTHHGSSAFDNVQLDEDATTLEHWAWAATEHTRLWPYRSGLARQAAERGTPMILPTAFVFDGEPFDRTDAWLLGPSLLVAPVVARGATARQVDLPAAAAWRDWWTLQPAASGEVQAAVDEIPVFVATGSVIPLFEVLPDTLLPDATGPGLVTAASAQAARRVLVVGDGGAFTEGDGTRYTVTGSVTGAAEATATLSAGTVEVGGVRVEIRGTTPRTYTVQVVP